MGSVGTALSYYPTLFPAARVSDPVAVSVALAVALRLYVRVGSAKPNVLIRASGVTVTARGVMLKFSRAKLKIKLVLVNVPNPIAYSPTSSPAARERDPMAVSVALEVALKLYVRVGSAVP